VWGVVVDFLKKKRLASTIELIFTEDLTAGLNPLVGAVNTDSAARKLVSEYPDYTMSWETFEVNGSDDALPDGTPLWILVQGGIFSETARYSPSPVAVFANLEDAQLACLEREQQHGEELILWTLPLGTVDISAPSWMYTGN